MLPMTPALPARGQRGGGTVADEQAESRGVDRRTVIKRAAAAGAVVWTAPVIIDSLASPAAALSCLNCFRVQIEVPQFAPCTTTTGPVDSNTCGTVIGPGCTTTPNVVSGVPIDHVCLSSLNCSFQQSPVVFTLDTTSACWDEGSCGAGRQILAARGLNSPPTGGPPLCTGGIVDPSGTTATFTATTPNWAGFQLVIGCVCSG
jgi:hypothetical protein